MNVALKTQLKNTLVYMNLEVIISNKIRKEICVNI